MKRLIIGCIAAVLAAPALDAEDVQLRNGVTLVGTVELDRTRRSVIVETQFPTTGRRTLSFDEITPASLYWIHERRTDHEDFDALVGLAELAMQAELHGVALAEYMEAMAVDPKRGRALKSRIRELEQEMAAEILDSVRTLIEEEKYNSALSYMHTILEVYPETRAADEAAKMMGDVHRLAGKSARIAEKTVAAAKVPSVLDDIEKDLAKGDEARKRAGGHVGSTTWSSKERRALERSIRFYERAWRDALSIPVVLEDSQTRIQADEIKLQARRKLVGAYLDAASIWLQRRSIPKAEEYCNAACEIEPENKDTHQVHRLILEAKAYGF